MGLTRGCKSGVLAFSIRPEALPAKRARFVAYLQRSERIVYPVIEDKYGSRFTLKPDLSNLPIHLANMN